MVDAQQFHLIPQSAFDQFKSEIREDLQKVAKEIKSCVIEAPMGPKEAMAFLKIKSKNTFWRKVHAGDIPFYKVGGSWYFYPSKINERIQKR